MNDFKIEDADNNFNKILSEINDPIITKTCSDINNTTNVENFIKNHKNNDEDLKTSNLEINLKHNEHTNINKDNLIKNKNLNDRSNE